MLSDTTSQVHAVHNQLCLACIQKLEKVQGSGFPTPLQCGAGYHLSVCTVRGIANTLLQALLCRLHPANDDRRAERFHLVGCQLATRRQVFLGTPKVTSLNFKPLFVWPTMSLQACWFVFAWQQLSPRNPQTLAHLLSSQRQAGSPPHTATR